jgi:tRNA G18 (ribose-2'-O)-methylase SpoU
MEELIRIPHSPKVESLNAGVAASIVLYEVARQRG